MNSGPQCFPLRTYVRLLRTDFKKDAQISNQGVPWDAHIFIPLSDRKFMTSAVSNVPWVCCKRRVSFVTTVEIRASYRWDFCLFVALNNTETMRDSKGCFANVFENVSVLNLPLLHANYFSNKSETSFENELGKMAHKVETWSKDSTDEVIEDTQSASATQKELP